MIELFKAGRQSIEDDLHSGRPPAAVSEENVEEVGHQVMHLVKFIHSSFIHQE